MACQSINPNDGKLVRSFEHLGAGQLEVSLADAESCFHSWKLVSYAECAVVLHRAAELMRSHVDDFAKLATLEMGKRIAEARGEVAFSADILAYYAEHAHAFLAQTQLRPKVGEAHMESSPFGVLFCVEPWNFPFYQLARVAGPQLKDISRGRRVASAVDTGMMFVNNIDWSDAELPFGGIKDSGYGRELGNMGIQEFVNKKLVRIANLDAPA